MSNEEHIKKGGLAEKMAGFTPDPPDTVWEGVSAQIQGGSSRRKIFVILAAAAGLALAITVGLSLLNQEIKEDFSVASNETEHQKTEVPEKNMLSVPVVKEMNRFEKTSAITEEGTSIQVSKVKKQSDRLEKKVKKVMQEEISSLVQDDKVLVAAADRIEAEPTVEEPIDAVIIDTTEKVALKIDEDSLIKILQADLPEEIEVIPEKESDKGKWKIGAGVAPQISYRDVASTNMQQNMAANNSESAKMTYTGGIQLSYKQSDRLTIESGVYYNTMGVHIGDNSSFKTNLFGNKLDEVFYDAGAGNVISLSNSMGTLGPTLSAQSISNYREVEGVADYNSISSEQIINLNSSANSYTQSFEYVEVPFNVRYKIFDSTFELQLIGGLSTNFLVGNSISAITNDETLNLGKVQDVRSVNYSGNAGLGFVFDILNNFSLSVEPRFKYYLNSINQGMLPSTRPYSFGVYTGLNYTF